MENCKFTTSPWKIHYLWYCVDLNRAMEVNRFFIRKEILFTVHMRSISWTRQFSGTVKKIQVEWYLIYAMVFDTVLLSCSLEDLWVDLCFDDFGKEGSQEYFSYRLVGLVVLGFNS